MSDCLIIYILEAESTETPDPDDEWSIQAYISACMPQANNTLVHHMWTFKATMYYMETGGKS